MSRAINYWVEPRQNESSEKRVARFRRWANRSRVANEIKDRRYRAKPLTKRKIREAALMRENYRALREKEKYYQ